MEKKMFYNANALIFKRASELRNDLTHAEMVLWGYLNRSQLGVRFKCQHPVSIYIADFYCHALKLVVEVDGGVHLNEDVKANDEIREQAIKELGITVIRFSNNQILNDIEFVLNTIKSHIKIPL